MEKGCSCIILALCFQLQQKSRNCRGVWTLKREWSVIKLSFPDPHQGAKWYPWILRKAQEDSDFIWITSPFSSFAKSISWCYLKQTPDTRHRFIQSVTKWFSNKDQGFLSFLSTVLWLHTQDSCSLQIWLVNKTGCYKGYLPYTTQGKSQLSERFWRWIFYQ